MTDHSITPDSTRRGRRSEPRFIDEAPEASRANNDVKVSYWTALDKPMILITALLLTIGAGMVFSTTFNWSLEVLGSSTAIFLQRHMRNVVLALAASTIFAVIDYRFWRRFAPLILLMTFGALVAVNIFGDDTFGARRALVSGSLQPGELAEFAVVLYMAAWLSAKRTKVDSFIFGFLPFLILIVLIIVPIIAQPDISTVVIILLTAGAMYFLAGARIWHLLLIGGLGASLGLAVVTTQPYAQTRIDSYLASLSDPTEANYHTQQVITAFVTGGWVGKGLGQSTQKFSALPAPHTDSIFAVIGEELGVVGAAFVVLLYIIFVIRGFQIARRAVDTFGSLLALGLTLLVAIQALLNIAVMAAVIPSTGLPLPFISYGGSALVVAMIGVGLMLSVSRVATIRSQTSNRRQDGATYDRGWGNRRSRLSRTSRRRSSSQVRKL
ncbi:MAG: putative peptidoglycan glycosyltransferase FtsW [Anaerolineae bacterium]|nr:putative peptidoglycan glycosyltransferase FtsW [Anaerolineae bacterium]